jgi:hypothetical protein
MAEDNPRPAAAAPKPKAEHGPPLFDRILGFVARRTAHYAPWHKLPFGLAIPTLAGIRVNMRWRNLYDTQRQPPPAVPPPPADLKQRTADGSWNDLDKPWMGMKGARFGRNFPLSECFAEDGERLMTPNPRLISNQLLARKEFVPVPHLNLFAAGWLQFMVHDWLTHGTNIRENPHEVALPEGDDWHVSPMTVLRTKPDQRWDCDEGKSATFTNDETHWWDGSQIYGSDLERQTLVRTDPETGEFLTDGKLGLQKDGNLPICNPAHDRGDAQGDRFANQELAGVTGNWWIALSLFHRLFVHEHNAIVDRLKVDHPDRDGEWLFQKARLVNAALIAKIHTTEWTPALMNSPSGRFVMRVNWWGLAGEQFGRGYGRLDDGETFSGILGSSTEHHAAPYAMTEEFAACYRMHSLIPDDFSFRRASDDGELLRATMLDVSHGETTALYKRIPVTDLVYSVGTSHPGALVLHNFPNTLRRLPGNPEKKIVNDLAVIDIVRDRERGVPRYCDFRRMMGMSVPKSWAKLTGNKQWQEELKAIYGKVEDVDLLVGTLVESAHGTPLGFGFSDTVFRIFILMASRRLKSDRFYTSDFTPEVYTPAGWAWIADNNLKSVFERHFPELRPHFTDCRNMFFPWAKGGAAPAGG